ncbi:MAG: type 4a pilus biogenesis protein PilO [Candidatus Omnitrophica bacterium]|nr:type 4a pilus biogenesis protein PilO [Candidatus Omnitrophota bacterium]
MVLVKLSRNTQIALLIAGGILMVHFYNQLLYKPLRKEAHVLRAEKMRIQEEIPLLDVKKEETAKVEEMYKKKFEEFSELQKSISALENNLPSKKDMAVLLEQLTSAFGGLKADFVSLEPTLHKAAEGEPYDSLEIEMQFYADYDRVIAYLKKLEEEPILLSTDKLEMVLDSEVSKKPLVTIYFSTFLSNRAKKQSEKVEEVVQAPAPSPFLSGGKPYDNRLPGDHHLTMVVWRGGKTVALVDGKIMKEGSILDNRTLTKIDSDGAWFDEDGVRYYLALEK